MINAGKILRRSLSIRPFVVVIIYHVSQDMPGGFKRSASVDAEQASCNSIKKAATAGCRSVHKSPDYYKKSHTNVRTQIDESPTRAVGYHLVDHEYGVTPKHQIIRDDPLVPPKTSEVSDFSI